jgi:tellurite resistance protein TerC
MNRSTLQVTYSTARRIVISVVGGSVVALGLAMLVLPGPGILVIAAGLAILAAEFAWARRWLKTVKKRGQQAIDGIRSRSAA